MSLAQRTRSRRIGAAVTLAVMAICASAARADEPLPLAAVIQRAVAYDPQVRAAQARLDAWAAQPAEASEPVRGRSLRTTRWVSGRPVAPPAPAVSADRDHAERELRRAREQAAERAAVAALDLQQRDRIVALAQQRATDARRLAQRNADPLRNPRITEADRRELAAAQRRADAALIDAQADRLAAADRLASIAGHVAQGVAAFDWPASPTPNPVGEEMAARERQDTITRQLREAQALAAAAQADPTRGIAQAVQARDALHAAERRAVEASHALALARLGEQMRTGAWSATLAEAARTETPVVAVAAATPQREAVDPSLEAAFRQWAQAWRSKDVGRYLASYAPEFEPAGISRDTWRAQRQARLSRPGPFDIVIDGHRWEASGNDVAEVRFVQRFRSATYADRSEKSLVWRNGPQGWRIVAELARTESVERPRRRGGA